LIEFLKKHNWRKQDTDNDWFVNKNGTHRYGNKTEANVLEAKSHCVFITGYRLTIGASTEGGSVDIRMPRIEV